MTITVGLGGCISYEDNPLAAETRSRLLTEREPVGPLSIAEARHEVLDHGAKRVVLEGRVGGVPDAFLTKPSGFFLTAAPGQASAAHSHDHDHGDDGQDHGDEATPSNATEPVSHVVAGHDPTDPNHADNCPFCRRKKLADKNTVLVQLTDASGEPLVGDPRELLGVAENQIVVIEGRPKLDGPNLYVWAEKVFIRK